MNVLAAKLILTPLLITLATLMAWRWGPAVGGWVAGLPLTSGPVSAFLAIEDGRTFAAGAARATLLGIIAVVSFCTGYSLAAKRLNWLASWALGLLFYFLAVVVVFIASPGIYVSILLVYLVITIALFVINATPFETVVRARQFSWDLPLRIIAATGMVVLITGVAPRIGPNWSGLLSPFPIFATVMAVFSHRTEGAQAAIHLLRGVVIGSFAFAAFFLIVALSIETSGIGVTYSLAAILALLVNAVSLTRLLRIRPPNKSNV